ncbi:Uncharacterised protein [Mycobacteroides abscessus subsp. abscessus]|nr:Uncharacterised protein [Mycobacteroides abscessus subsp. abscessus]
MDRKLIYKMAAGCLGQYGFDGSLIKPGSREFEELYRRIEEKKNEDAETDLHEIALLLRTARMKNKQDPLLEGPVCWRKADFLTLLASFSVY